ncbi:hypothetical protein CSOJ01_15786 [Colletotrichum sojae]|uniref:Oxidoreductase acuF-like C2H2 type zinc-finger domain-containing protein n=1 Tax=Colletotrichum sojae TaxID=2175907 RepID=A0A8H6ILJ7_9PEZI|nr:hypothetical protein CSOJ01_15786 [Colletotrichum sojae]
MVLWAEGYGVVEGKLDDVLSASRTLERSLLRLLKSIGKMLSDRLIPKLVSEEEDVHARTSLLQSLTATARFTLQEGRQGSDSEDSDSYASSVSEESDMDVDWAEIADDLRTDIECLMDLEPLIKTPFIRPQSQNRVENSMPQPESWTPEKMYSDRIGHRFPKAQLDLVARLARANWHRFQRIQSEKERSVAAKKELAEREVYVGPAATVVSSSEPASFFHDSGLGTSVATGSSYAQTTMSYQQIPPLPMDAKKGVPFDCLSCGREVRITNNSDWKKHLFKDLRPWICHEVSCSYGTEPFQSREDWAQHLELQHNHGVVSQPKECPLCLEIVGQGNTQFLKHVSSHFEEISLSSLPTGVPSDCESEEESASDREEFPESSEASNSETSQPLFLEDNRFITALDDDLRSERMTEAEAREALSEYVVYRFEKVVDPNETDHEGYPVRLTWENVKRVEVRDLSRRDIIRSIRELNAEGRTALQKKTDLTPSQQQQIETAQDALETRNLDKRFHYTLQQISHKFRKLPKDSFQYQQYMAERESKKLIVAKGKSAGSKERKSKNNLFEAVSLIVYFKMEPRLEENALSMYRSKQSEVAMGQRRDMESSPLSQ